MIYLNYRRIEEVAASRLREYADSHGLQRRLIKSSLRGSVQEAVWEYQRYKGPASGSSVRVRTRESLKEIFPGVWQVDHLGTELLSQREGDG